MWNACGSITLLGTNPIHMELRANGLTHQQVIELTTQLLHLVNSDLETHVRVR